MVIKLEKKHEIEIITTQGKFTVATNDIQDLLSQPIISRMLGVSARQQEPEPQAVSNPDVQEMKNAIMQLQQQVQMARRAQQEAEFNLQSQAQPQQPKQAEAKSANVQEAMQRTQVAPVQAEESKKLPPSSFLDITPNNMEKSIWASLNAEQQQTWLQKYNIR